MRILILVDQPGVAEALALNLRMSGYPAIGFTRPAEALSAIRKTDVLVTNYHLPVMMGLEVARKAYEQGWRGSLFIWSGYSKTIADVIEHPFLHFIRNRK